MQMSRSKGWSRGRLCLGVLIVLGGALASTNGWAQLDISGAELDADYIELIQGDLEIENWGTDEEQILYTNPEGRVELEIATGKGSISIQAKTIKVTDGQKELLAKGGVLIDDGTTTLKGQSATYWIEQGHAQLDGNAQYSQKLDRERSNHWAGDKMEAWFEDGKLKKLKLKNTKKSRLYTGKGQMSRFLTSQKGSSPSDETSSVYSRRPTPKPAPEPTATSKPLKRILAPMAE